jgi:hypothetical protein
MKRKTGVLMGLGSAVLALAVLNPRNCVSETLAQPFILYRAEKRIQSSIERGWMSLSSLNPDYAGHDVKEGERVWQRILADRNWDGHISYNELESYIFGE